MDIEHEIIVDANPPQPSNPILNPNEADKAGFSAEETKPDPDPADPAADEKKKEYSEKVQQRINKEIAKRKSAEEALRRVEDRLLTIEARQQPTPSVPLQDIGEPTIDNFTSFDEYVRAVSDYRAEKKIQAALDEREKREAAARATAERQKTVEGWSKRLREATAEMPDYDEVVGASDIPMTPIVERVILESEIGPKLAYYLANNPDEATELARMSPVAAIRTLGRIEERLATAKPEKKLTDAPPPIKPIGTKTVVAKDPGKMSDAEYAKWRKQGQAA